MYKRILSAILAVLMMASMNTPVIAEGQTPAGEEPVPAEVQETPSAEEESADEGEPEAPAEDQPEAPAEPGDEAGDAGESGDAAPADEEEPAVEPAAEEAEPAAEEAPAEEAPAQEITLVTPEPVTFNGVTVTVSYLSDAFDGKNVRLVVGEAGAAETAALDASGRAYKAVDVSFVDENGNPVQPAEGKTVSVALKADGMEAAGDYEVVHVDAEGNTTAVLANVETSNPVTEPVKTGVTTRTVEVPAETETVIVEDYEEETYTDYETVEKTIEVPAEIGYRTVRKSRVVEKTVISSGISKILWLIGLRPTPAKKKVVEYYYVEEPYEITPAHTETITETVPVTKTRKVLVGTHEDTKVIKEAYSYEVTEDVYEDITRNDVETSFSAASFSVYAIVAVEEDGSLDFDETFGADHITVKAPTGAFEAGTTMKIETVDDPEILANALKALENNTYSIYGIDISFWKDGTEVEPALPVKVTWTSEYINAGDTLVHINDDGTAEKVSDVLVREDKTVFTTDTFSTYTTTRLDTFPVGPGTQVVFNPSSLVTSQITMNSGELSSTHPEFDGYTYVNATYQKTGEQPSDDLVTYLGAFIYQEFNDDGTPAGDPIEYVYYRTVSTAGDSDLIVKLADDETIHLNYESTPLPITYNVVYNGTTYHMANAAEVDALMAALGDDADDLVFEGPTSVKRNVDYPEAVRVEIPRGFTGQLTYNGTNQTPQLGVEPTHTLNSEHKIITRNGELDLDYNYDINTRNPLTVTLTLTKRTSFTFDASYFLRTVYTGGYYNNQDANYGDYRISNTLGARLYGDGTLGTSGNNKGKKTFTADTVSWSFTTQNKKDSGKSQTGDQWMVDALEINGTTIEIPYANPGDSLPVSKTTTLPSGTVVTVSLTNIVNERDNYTGTARTNYRRSYTITVTNCHEDIVITGGNIVDIDVSTEIIPEVLDNVNYAFNGYSTSDRAYSGTGFGWQEWGVGEPIAVGASQSVAGGRNWNMYGFNQTNNNAMRFQVPTGYYNPEIAFESTTGTDLIGNIGLGSGLSRGAKNADGYYPITGNPTGGYYYFRVTNYTGNDRNVALLRIRASLMRYGVSYAKGEISVDATIPEYDYGGWYDDAHQNLQGYNVVDNDYVVISKSAPTAEGYVFLYYTIDGDSGETHYSPSQKVALNTIAQYAEYDSTKGEFVIPLVAHWEEKTSTSPINVTAHVYLDDIKEESVTTQVPIGSSVYIDIDSDTMTEIMGKYNWQLFYDETGSDPFISEVNEENNEVTLRLYSKFYVYHSGTGELELHTTKEMEYQDGTDEHEDPILKIGKLNITKLTESGYLYGGYYMDYTGAHEGNDTAGTNLVKAAADYDNDYGTLTTANIVALSKGEAVTIQESIGTPYNPSVTAAHSGYWNGNDAFTETEKTIAADSGWYSNRGEKDTAALATGGNGTEVKIARAGIYYLKEVPNTYLRPTQMTTYQRYDKYLRDFILLSTTDDGNYSEAGFIINSGEPTVAEVFSEKLTINFGPNYDDTVTPKEGSDGGYIEVDVKKASSDHNKGGLIAAYRVFHLADETNKDYRGIIGNTLFEPYWVTPDGIQVTGNVMRRETVKDKNGNRIIEVYTGEGTDTDPGEIKHRDFVSVIHAAKR